MTQMVRRSRAVAVSVLLVAFCMGLMAVTIVNVDLPSIPQDGGATREHRAWIVSGYLLGLAALLITGGRLGDIFGRRRVFVIGITGFTAASLLAGLAPTAESLVGFRAVQGLFAGVMVPQVLSIDRKST